MALCKIKQKNFEEGVRDATKAIEADPKYTKGFYRRATANIKLGKKMEACLDYKRILDIDSENEQVRKELEKVKAKLNEKELDRVNAFNEGFRRVEIQETEDSSDESDTSYTTDSETEQKEILKEERKKQEARWVKKNNQIGDFVKELRRKKEKITQKIKEGLFEGVMAEMCELVSEAEERRAEVFNVGQFKAGDTLVSVRKTQEISLNNSTLNRWLDTTPLKIPKENLVPNLYDMLELEMSLKSNLCYSYKQISQEKSLIFLASNVLELCASVMANKGSLGKTAGKIFQKTIKRRALGLEQSERWRDSFRDFWVARTFNAEDMMIINGLNRSKGLLGSGLMEETRKIEKDFENYLHSLRVEKKTKTKQDDLLTSTVFERVPREDEANPSSQKKESEFTSVEASPVKVEEGKTEEPKPEEKQVTPQEDSETKVVSKEEKNTQPKTNIPTPVSKKLFDTSPSSGIGRKLTTTELDQLERIKQEGNAMFRQKNISGAAMKFSELIEEVLKGALVDFLKGIFKS
jgi:tetratricopeptide (TPR) repeat protein